MKLLTTVVSAPPKRWRRGKSEKRVEYLARVRSKSGKKKVRRGHSGCRKVKQGQRKYGAKLQSGHVKQKVDWSKFGKTLLEGKRRKKTTQEAAKGRTRNKIRI